MEARRTRRERWKSRHRSHWRGSMASFVFIFAELVRPELRCGGEGLLVFSSNMAADKWQSLTSPHGTNTEISELSQ